MNLFIVGNGFDVAHGIDSSYEHFRNYISNFKTDIFFERRIPTYNALGYQMVEADNGLDILKIIIDTCTTDRKWKNFEETLGQLDFTVLLESYEEDNKEWIKERNQEKIATLIDSANAIKELFREWVDKIKIHKNKKMDFAQLITNDDIVLSFNYTQTLEEVYGIKNVYHIHGEKGKEITVGHGDCENIEDTIEDIYPGSFAGCNQIKAILRKNVPHILSSEKTKQFMQSIKHGGINTIYSYGFSYSDVDMPYIEEICKHLSANATWLFHDYPEETEIEQFSKKIRNAGFCGTIDKFHVE